MTTAAFHLTPIPADVASELRRTGGSVYVADSVPGYPCRLCLTDAEIGEELVLVSHDPFAGDSAYRSASPIFVHREPCQPFVGNTLPLQLTRRQLSVRSFDAEDMMIEAAVVAGSTLGETLHGFFSTETCERVHIHNADRGCWAATIPRTDLETHQVGQD